MALTQGAWTQKNIGISKGSKYQVWTNSVTATTAEHDAYTLPTPVTLDTSRQFELLVSFSGTPDGQALPLDLWGGYGDSFLISGDDSTVAAANGFKIKQLFDDVVLAVSPLVYHFVLDPALPVADVVAVSAIASGPKVRIPMAPRLAFNLNGGSTLAAETATFTIIQKVQD